MSGDSKKQLAKEEILRLKKQYNKDMTILNKSFPLLFKIIFVPMNDIGIDFEGLGITFSMPEKYPDEVCTIAHVEGIKGQELPPKLTVKIRDGLNAYAKKIHDGKPIVERLLAWCDTQHLKSIIMVPEFVMSYLADGIDGCTQRRYSIKQVAPETVVTTSTAVKQEAPKVTTPAPTPATTVQTQHSSSEEASDSEDDDSDEHSHDEYSESDDEQEEDEDNTIHLYSLINPPPQISVQSCETGIILQFDDIDFKQTVSVMECSDLSFNVSCTRCTERIPIRDLKPPADKKSHTFACPKCQKEMDALFHPHTITDKSMQAPTITTESSETSAEEKNVQVFAQVELNGCTFWDVMPGCQFTAICYECSTPCQMSLKLRSVNEQVCLKCHKTLTIIAKSLSKKTFAEYLESAQQAQPKIVFKKKRPSAPSSAVKKPRPKKLLGITPGTPLPKTGVCKHYKHSHRWLRFPCCQQAFPCDDCHDEVEGHKSRWAAKMICGYCSREQNLSDRCIYCEKNTTKKVAAKKSNSALKKHEQQIKPKKKKESKK